MHYNGEFLTLRWPIHLGCLGLRATGTGFVWSAGNTKEQNTDINNWCVYVWLTDCWHKAISLPCVNLDVLEDLLCSACCSRLRSIQKTVHSLIKEKKMWLWLLEQNLLFQGAVMHWHVENLKTCYLWFTTQLIKQSLECAFGSLVLTFIISIIDHSAIRTASFILL